MSDDSTMDGWNQWAKENAPDLLDKKDDAPAAPEAPQDDAPPAEPQAPPADDAPPSDPPPPTETERRVLRYKYDREDQEVDLERLATDEDYAKEYREYIERGRAVDRTDDRVARAREEAQAEAYAKARQWVESQGYGVSPDGRLVAPQPKTPAAPETTAPGLEDLIPKVREGDPEAIANALQAIASRKGPDVESVVEQRMAAYRQEQARAATEQRLKTEIDKRLAQHKTTFDASPQREQWEQFARQSALNRAYQQGAQWEDVLGEIDRTAGLVNAERKATIERVGASTQPKIPAPPVPTGGPAPRSTPQDPNDIDWGAEDKGLGQVAEMLRRQHEKIHGSAPR